MGRNAPWYGISHKWDYINVKQHPYKKRAIFAGLSDKSTDRFFLPQQGQSGNVVQMLFKVGLSIFLDVDRYPFDSDISINIVSLGLFCVKIFHNSFFSLSCFSPESVGKHVPDFFFTFISIAWIIWQGLCLIKYN